MIALFDFIPEYCPNCGLKLGMHGINLLDYADHSPFSCDCGLVFKKVSEPFAEAAVKESKEVNE
jgi:hypothetical protein